MKKRIDPDRFLQYLKKAELDNKPSEKSLRETLGLGAWWSGVETCLAIVKSAICMATVCECSAEQKSPEQPFCAKSYPHAFSDEHRNLLELRDECRNTIKVGVDIAFSTREEWRQLYETGKYTGCVPPKGEIPMLKDYIVKKIIESKELDEKIAEIEKGTAK